MRRLGLLLYDRSLGYSVCQIQRSRPYVGYADMTDKVMYIAINQESIDKSQVESFQAAELRVADNQRPRLAAGL